MPDAHIPGSNYRATQITIYVGNISAAITELELRNIFEPFGGVMDITIFDEQHTGNGHMKTYAYVGMANKNQGEAAIASLDGTLIGNEAIQVIGALRLSSLHHSR